MVRKKKQASAHRADDNRDNVTGERGDKLTEGDVSLSPGHHVPVSPPHPLTLSPGWAWALVIVVIVSAAAIRGRLLDFPLERDEGEYAYIGQLMLQGVPPYRDVAAMKLPGTFVVYAFFLALFGETPAGIHLGLLLVNSATILLIFLLGRRLLGGTAGVAASAAFAVLTLNRGVLAFAGHATHFLALCAVGGALLLCESVRECESRSANALSLFHFRTLARLFASGLLFGLAIVMKQHGGCFAVFGFLYLLWHDWRQVPRDWRRQLVRAGLFAFGVVLPFAVTCLILAGVGVFDRFWFWTFTYASKYVTLPSFAVGLDDLEKQISGIVGPDWGLWLLAGVGLVAVWWRGEQRGSAIFLTGLLLASVLAVSLGLYFRPHYFIMLLPVLALLDGAAVMVIGRALLRRGRTAVEAFAIPTVVLAAALGWPLVEDADLLFEYTPTQACFVTYMENPFVEAEIIGRYIRERTTLDDTIAVLGSEPEIFFYAGRRSATRHIYVYPLMEAHPFALEMQKEAIAEIEASAPKFFVIVAVGGSWLGRDDSEKLILNWAQKYHHARYVPVGLIDIGRPWDMRGLQNIGPTTTKYYWGNDAIKKKPQSPFFVKVYQRKAEPE